MLVQVEHRYSKEEPYAELSFRVSPKSEFSKQRISDLSTIDDEVKKVGCKLHPQLL